MQIDSLDSEIKEQEPSEIYNESNSYNDILTKILSIEIPKTKVIVRKRPLNQKEISTKEVDNIAIIDHNKVVLSELKKSLELKKYIEKKEFIFDKAYDEKAGNDFLYKEEIRPMIYNAFYQKTKITCFAYGQTGSGKTYTLFGNINTNTSNKHVVVGLYALAGYDIFQIKSLDNQFSKIDIFVSFYEIYCDKLYDLLNNRNRLETREDYKHEINIVGLSENKINSLEELMKIVNVGTRQRIVGKTGANSESSRSHGIIQLRLFDTSNNTEHAKISFIDLAGSERESDKINVDKKTRIDGAAINQSLLALKECIRALEQDKIHLPFRGNKLTLVLRDSFIGNCKTLMISTISPGYKTSEHTLNTLRYSYRLKELKSMGNAAKNFKANNAGGNKNNSKNNNDLKNDPNAFISNLLSNNLLFGNNLNTNINSKNNNNNNNNNRNISSDSKNNDEKDFYNKLMKKQPIKRKKSLSSSNSSMKDVRDNSNESCFKKRKDGKKMNSNNNIQNNIKPIKGNNDNNVLKIENKKEPNSQNLNTSNNLYNLALMTSNISKNANNNNDNNNKIQENIFHPMNITQNINLNNHNLNNINNNNNNNFSFNLFNENENILNISNNSLFSFQSSTFNNLSLEELEKKNDKMVEDIVNQEKIVRKNQQTHINTMCELIKNEISTFQQYQQEQMDITTYIEAMKGILKSESSQYDEFNGQLEKLNYMIKQQIKLSDLIEQMKHNQNSKLNLSDNKNGNNHLMMEDQNMINLKNLENIQNQINGFY